MMERVQTSEMAKSEFRKAGYTSRSFEMMSKDCKINTSDYSTSPHETRKRSVSLTSRIIDNYMREENTKQLNKKEFEKAYQKVYGGDASRNSTLLISDKNAIWTCGNYVEAARFFL